jgi:hypothetical protein
VALVAKVLPIDVRQASKIKELAVSHWKMINSRLLAPNEMTS